ncbi:hypothetical protein FCM35_KLT05665 [Carex littledalei]|uniref:Uncharacterized protein n=1 Tax=Carex littledalei TaxID=544730 RepID=A0A833V8D4_9POAL|nr:hypothetical protein FCM35_KLT05665 [Carex littledalei]
MEWFKDSVFRIRCVSGGKSGARRFKFGACGIEGKRTKMPRGSAPRVNVVRDAVLAKRQTKRYPTYHADYAYQQALYSPQMSPQYYQYGQTSPLPGTPQPYNYPQIGFTTNPRAGLQAPQLGALSPYIQQTTALIDPSFITPVLKLVMVDQGGEEVRERAKAMKGVMKIAWMRYLQRPCRAILLISAILQIGLEF